MIGMNEEEQLNSELSEHERARSAWFDLIIVYAAFINLGL